MVENGDNDVNKFFEEFEEIVSSSDSQDISEGKRIVGAFIAIIKWLRLENEFSSINVYRQSRDLFFHAIKGTYNIDDDDINDANEIGIQIANASYSATLSFREFIKSLKVTGVDKQLSPSGSGDLCLGLYLCLKVINEYEYSSIKTKYAQDIEDICQHQLDASNIMLESKKIADEVFSNFKEDLQQKWPIDPYVSG